MSSDVVDRVVEAVERDLRDGTWEERHGHLRELDEYDAGMRLLVSTMHNQPSTVDEGDRGEKGQDG